MWFGKLYSCLQMVSDRPLKGIGSNGCQPQATQVSVDVINSSSKGGAHANHRGHVTLKLYTQRYSGALVLQCVSTERMAMYKVSATIAIRGCEAPIRDRVC